MGIKYLLSLSFIFLIGLANAQVICDNNYFALNYNQTQSVSRTAHCTNNFSSSVSLTKSGDYFTIDTNTLNSNEAKDITINFDSNSPVGLHTGQISFSDSSTPIQLFFYTNQNIIQNPNGVIVFPTAKVINIQQNQEKAQNIQIIVPSTYPRNIVIQSVTQNPEIDLIKFNDLNLGTISSGMTLNIPFTIDSTNAQTGTYQTLINILATDSQGQVQLSPVNIQIIVSASINPVGNGSLVRPSCSLSANTFTLNQTATLTCTNAVSNLDISPQYNELIQGINAQVSSGVYTYTFQPIKIGSSSLVTHFEYLNSPIFSPDIEGFKIIPNSFTGSGQSSLDVDFFQGGVKISKDKLGIGETRFLVVDSSSRNIINNYGVYLNGENYNGTTFNISLNKVYDLRFSSDGYNTLDLNISANLVPLNFNLIPEKSEYLTGDAITINSTVQNFSLILNDVITSNPIYLSQAGINKLQVVKEGYLTGYANISVKSVPTIQSCSPIKTDWKKGSSVICSLSENSSWSVYLNNVQLSSGVGNNINFKISDYGQIDIKSNERNIDSYNLVNNFVWYNPSTWGLLFKVGGALVAIVLIVFVIRKYNGGRSSDISFGTKVG